MGLAYSVFCEYAATDFGRFARFAKAIAEIFEISVIREG
jgi:hypothetical protein